MSNAKDRLIEEALEGQISRRQLIQRLALMGVAAPVIASMLAEAGLVTAAEAAEMLATPKKGGTLKVGYLQAAASVDPVTMFNEGAILAVQMSMEYLTYPRPDYSLEPKLAVKWHAVNPKKWIFNLRKGVKWHNGKAFTADDVVYTFNLLTDPATNSAALTAFKGILAKGGTRKIDAHTVEFNLERGYAGFPWIVSPLTYNSAILPKGYKVGDFVKGHIGTGPYILTNYATKQSATYVKNPHYWNKKLPYLNGVDLKYYSDQQSVVVALQAGDIHIAPNGTYQGGLALFSNSSIKVLRNPGSAYREFHMRVDQAPFTDVRVRQAVAYSLNRPALVKLLLNNLGTIGNDQAFAPVFGPLSAASKKVPQYKQNYAKAKALLAAAGHSSLDVTLTYEDYLEIPDYATAIKSQLAPAGINVNLNKEDQNTYYGSGNNQPWLQVPMGIVDWAPRGTPSQVITPAYLSSAIPPPYSTGWNSAHWSSKTFDHLVADADKQTNKAKYDKDVFQAATIQHNAVPAVIAYWIDDLHFLSKKLNGVPKGPGPYPDFSAAWLS